jgi:Zn-dependent M28 family amino/carboxypeptidase
MKSLPILLLALSLHGCGNKGENRPQPADTTRSTMSIQNTIDPAELRRHVTKLATEIGERNTDEPAAYRAAADYIEAELRAAGYTTARQTFRAGGMDCVNIEAELTGATNPDEIIVIGGHYDSVSESPGANDNGSGVAATLAIARMMAGHPMARTIRFVAFANEEPPYFQTAQMGSLVYARRCRERGEKIVGMISLETIGFYSDAPGSQHYPPPLAAAHSSTGNFIGFVSDTESSDLLARFTEAFRRASDFPVETASIPAAIPGTGWSDHWSFWQEGYPAIMITDTAPFRYPHYHTPDDTPDKIDYERMAAVVAGVAEAVRSLATL